MTLEDLETATRAEMSAIWLELFQTPVPKGLSQTLMRRFLATEIQTREKGGLSKAVRTALQVRPEDQNRARSPNLKPGATLLREWNGVAHRVEVAADGFVWNGTTYRSLSVIARAITGAHWSGPRFFGLKSGKSA
jgi:hypothetical protein